MTTLITPDLVALDADLGSSSESVIKHLVDSVVATGRADDAAGLLADAMAREGQAAVPSTSPRQLWPSRGCCPRCRSAPPTGPRTWSS